MFAACAFGFALTARAGERVGTYDSRVVAYACFWDPGAQAARQALMAEGRAAKARGDSARFTEIDRQLSREQNEIHLQVFSTAPIPGAMEKLRDRAEVVCREAGVARLVSKWDEAALQAVPAADRVDVTDALIRDLKLTDRQRKIASDLATKEPLPLAKARELAAAGKL